MCRVKRRGRLTSLERAKTGSLFLSSVLNVATDLGSGIPPRYLKQGGATLKEHPRKIEGGRKNNQEFVFLYLLPQLLSFAPEA